MDLGCPLLRGSFVRRLRRRAATEVQFAGSVLENFLPNVVRLEVDICQNEEMRKVYMPLT